MTADTLTRTLDTMSRWIPEQFHDLIDASGGPKACWLFIGPSTDARGYGRFNAPPAERLAHRRAWAEAFGPIPAGLCVLHRCDNPPCCNPAHLFLGTRADNNADMAAKGRANNGGLRGVAHGRALLSNRDVRMIRRSTSTQRHLAAHFGISQSQVCRIRLHQSWRHLP